MSRTGIVDYGMGNLKSVANAVEKVGGHPVLVADPGSLAEFDHLILPGVGAFAQAIATLRATGLADALTEYAGSGRPLLGICLGMQLMCRSSEEGGVNAGLGWFDIDVVRFPAEPGLRVPQIGWNTVEVQRAHPLFEGMEDRFDVYFLHSYYARPDQTADVLGMTQHGVRYASMLGRDNLCAMQFHPEKSHHVGLTLLSNFIHNMD